MNIKTGATQKSSALHEGDDNLVYFEGLTPTDDIVIRNKNKDENYYWQNQNNTSRFETPTRAAFEHLNTNVVLNIILSSDKFKFYQIHQASLPLDLAHSFHSIIENVSLSKMQVAILPALEDNYMYLISDDNTKSAAIIDPVSPDLVLEEVNKRGLSLQSILTTHHHWDHDGGNEKLTQLLDKLTVYGGDPRIKCVNKIIKNGDVFEIGTLKVKCMFTPCHTSGHMCYLVSSDSEPSALFSGDTLFVGGCGRFFEGTAEQMYTALCEVLASLPDDTKVFCGHEYTISNLKFAHKVDPLNQDVIKKLEWAEERRKNHQPTVPSSIGDEKRTNPFMRVGVSSITECTDSSKREAAITVLGGLRKEKDSFQG